jgi:hypothetical protein
MLKIISKITAIILIALVLSVGLDSLYRQAYKIDYKLPENILIAPEITEKYDLVALGNSHSQSGLVFDGYTTKSLHLASVAQSFEYDLAMLKMHTKQIKENAVIIINVSPLSFSQNKPKRDDDANMNYYDGRLSPFLIPHLKLSEYLQIQILPFVRSGFLWREKHAKEMGDVAMETFIKQWEKPKSLTEAPQPAPVPALKTTPIQPTPTPKGDMTAKEITAKLTALSSPANDKFIDSAQFVVNKWFNSGGFSTASFNENKKDLQKIIEYSLKNNWRPVLITLPISQVLLYNLDPHYMNEFVYEPVKEVNVKNIDYIDFTLNPQLTKNYDLFSNSDHLNNIGATVTSYLLLQELIKAGYLPKEADGYDYH